jgi:hypothetical protein
MISLRLVRLIEANADSLAKNLVTKLHTSPQTQGMRVVPDNDLYERCLEVYAHLSDWLLDKSSAEIEQRFRFMGDVRARQGVPLPDVLWSVFLTKDQLWGFLDRQGLLKGPIELHSELELLRLLDRFFDRGIYHLTAGYETVRPALPSPVPATGKGVPGESQSSQSGVRPSL